MSQRVWSMMFVALVAVTASVMDPADAAAQGRGQPTDWNNFMYYPYVYYPQNFQPPVQYDHLYYRYPEERRIPVYNKDWHNFYTMPKPYYKGYHFALDVF